MTDTKTVSVHIRMTPQEVEHMDAMCLVAMSRTGLDASSGSTFGGPVVSRSEIIRHALDKLAEEMGVVG